MKVDTSIYMLEKVKIQVDEILDTRAMSGIPYAL